ncbi:MAG TPA: hypothetical protein VFJ47_09445 [Terriglobales bacterium]|jgi:hypothetical protein|nr:hypothetical protein [Terriglobales bacterium]
MKVKAVVMQTTLANITCKIDIVCIAFLSEDCGPLWGIAVEQ